MGAAARARSSIEFSTLEDLERIYRVITEGRPGERLHRRRVAGRAQAVSAAEPRCTPATIAAPTSGHARRRRRASPSTSSAGAARTPPRPCASRGAPRRCGRGRRPPRPSSGCELLADRGGDAVPGLGTEAARREVAAPAAGRRPAPDREEQVGGVAVGLGRDHPSRRRQRCRAPRPRRRRAGRGRCRLPSVSKPGRDGDEAPACPTRLRAPRAERLALADAGDLAFRPGPRRRAVQAVERGLGPQMPSAVSPTLRWNSRSAAAVVVTEDAVLAAGVEAERVQPALELGDVVAAQHRPALVEHADRRGGSRSRRAPTTSRVRRCRRRAARGRPGTPRPRVRSRRRTAPLRRGGTCEAERAEALLEIPDGLAAGCPAGGRRGSAQPMNSARSWRS